MEVRVGAEVGLKNPAQFELPKIKLTENPGRLPGSDTTNRQAEEDSAASRAIRPNEMKARYQLLGNTINMQA
ncbi:MAG: hypothetical protein H7A21_10935 [Spirochaetales bacterium]|nr:hypothetical protein [Leptospiraceae bacterium]MCP5481939.1 hypothetical protein [Spirochaetales bacterium]